jgi:hypothetical protein
VRGAVSHRHLELDIERPLGIAVPEFRRDLAVAACRVRRFVPATIS